MIFNFHDIVADGLPVRSDQITVSTFRQQISWIQQHFKIVRIDTLIEKFQTEDLQEPLAAISFDDGYRSHYSIVKPILDELNIKAVFYISSAHLEHNYYWHDLVETFCQHSSVQQQLELSNLVCSLSPKSESSIIESIKYLTLADRAIALSLITEFTKPLMKNRLLMNSAEVLELAKNGHLVGGHTLNHPILSLETELTCTNEICNDLIALDNLLQHKVISFAYPNGIPGRDFNHTHQDILARYGIKYAVNTYKSILTKPLNLLSIPRVNLYGANDSFHCNYLLRMILKSFFTSNTQ